MQRNHCASILIARACRYGERLPWSRRVRWLMEIVRGRRTVSISCRIASLLSERV